ncbi:DNA processing protein DprA [Weizmannia acidilactici]|uniref:DNA processing protein DprA n=1 Tax=Weizmannia acidilactici TaxID=2607726 RepID=A0A5J4JCS6_9BACI|nr:DNA-processing protein DprA [Weizmannia acidilactici]GER65611.1 DNA processing protein DprA [Weizmannia acidilactici]GER69059.1 DNA processing protein DprA [Weizmannia acidilactici]GER71968.1 DNA processing protein DprA [Weizmannia acidilactici]
MEPLKIKYIHLDHCRGLSLRQKMHILQFDPQLEKLYRMPREALRTLLRMNRNAFDTFYNDLHHLELKPYLALYKKKGIRATAAFEPEYPALLKETYEPPIVLYSMGDISLLKRRCLAVVGSRKSGTYAEKVVDRLFPDLIEKNFVIVSGLAKGADTIAHRAAMKFGGKTIAVLGSGFFHIYPRGNTVLAEKIKQNHLLLSEYPPFTRPQKWHFPERNRIISGISEGVVVIQAERRSGSLITADFALQEGREVFSIPGNVLDSLSEGTNHLIQQGAKLVANSSDILEELRI